jgi:hypothetical protein
MPWYVLRTALGHEDTVLADVTEALRRNGIAGISVRRSRKPFHLLLGLQRLDPAVVRAVYSVEKCLGFRGGVRPKPILGPELEAWFGASVVDAVVFPSLPLDPLDSETEKALRGKSWAKRRRRETAFIFGLLGLALVLYLLRLCGPH